MVTVGVPGWLEGGLGMASRTINIPATTNLDADELTSGTVPFARLSVGTGSTQVAVGDHTHTAADVGAVGATALDTDGTLAANSDAKVATQKAVKAYVAAHGVDQGQLVRQARFFGG